MFSIAIREKVECVGGCESEMINIGEVSTVVNVVIVKMMKIQLNNYANAKP